ncbi:MAG: zinc metalloprotease HtpX [Candidatus Methanodesulfokora sp.]|jgi:heat shock protein HtpX
MSIWRLRLAVLGTLALLIGISTLIFAVVLTLINSLSIYLLVILVAGFNLLQWLIAPYIIDAMYGTRPIEESENPRLHAIVRTLAERSGIKKPKLMLADVPIPNAFAYGSPLTGSRVAVTRGLLSSLEDEEIEAVLGHELGHLKHKDVQIMMVASLLPAIFYYIGYSLLWSGYSRDRESASPALIGMILIFFYWILNLIVLGLSRLREYYADYHSVSIVPDGRRKLAEALAKIVHYTSAHPMRQALGFKALLISDPDRAARDYAELSHIGYTDSELVQKILSRRVTMTDRIVELFSTHPNIVKRIKAILSYQS